MKFYQRILGELRCEEHTFKTIYAHTFSFPDNIAFERNENLTIERVTYAACRERALRLAAFISERAARGDVLALVMNNCELWVECFWAILLSGCKPLLLSPQMAPDALDAALADSGCKTILGDYTGREDISISRDALINAVPVTPLAREPDAPMGDEVILATSGTTGDVKLCAFDGRALCAQILNSEYVLARCRDISRFHRGRIKLLAFLPFYHVFGLTACLFWFAIFGSTFVFLNDYKPETILRACRLHEVTHVFAVPAMWDTLCLRIRAEVERRGIADKFDKAARLSLRLQDVFPRLGKLVAAALFSGARKQTLGKSIRFLISGGGVLKTETLRTINAIGYTLENGYGMTEIGIACVTLRKKASERAGAAVGKPFPSLEFRIDELGQLCVKGQSCHTARYIGGKRVPRAADEWFETGDSFSQNAHGEYAIFGRLDDMINGANGERISPDMVESLISLDMDACVMRDGGGALALVINLPYSARVDRDSFEIEMRRVHAAIAALPPALQPRGVLIAERALPLSQSGKIRRRELREGVLSGEFPCATEDECAISIDGKREARALVSEMQQIFQSVTRSPQPVGEHSHFIRDLGGDSLMYIELLSRIEERWHVKLLGASASLAITPYEAAELVLSAFKRADCERTSA